MIRLGDRIPSIALVGVGDVCTRFHVPALKSLKARVVAAVDPNPAALARARRAFPRIQTVSSPSNLPDGADCALVSSPSTFHARQTVELLERGVHVLCEKPIACTLADAEAMVRAAEVHGRTLQVGYFRRFHPTAQTIRHALKRAEWGAPKRCLMVIGHEWRPGELSPSTMDARLSGGGVLIDVGVHVLDRACSWFDRLAHVEYLDDNRGGMEANALVRLAGNADGSGIPVTIVLSRTRALGWNTVVEFERGTVICDTNEGSEMTWIPPSAPGSNAQGPQQRIRLSPPRDTIAYLVAEWEEFLSRVRGGNEVHSSVRDAVHVTELVEDCYGSRKPLPMVWDEPKMLEGM